MRRLISLASVTAGALLAVLLLTGLQCNREPAGGPDPSELVVRIVGERTITLADLETAPEAVAEAPGAPFAPGMPGTMQRRGMTPPTPPDGDVRTFEPEELTEAGEPGDGGPPGPGAPAPGGPGPGGFGPGMGPGPPSPEDFKLDFTEEPDDSITAEAVGLAAPEEAEFAGGTRTTTKIPMGPQGAEEDLAFHTASYKTSLPLDQVVKFYEGKYGGELKDPGPMVKGYAGSLPGDLGKAERVWFMLQDQKITHIALFKQADGTRVDLAHWAEVPQMVRMMLTMAMNQGGGGPMGFGGPGGAGPPPKGRVPRGPGSGGPNRPGN